MPETRSEKSQQESATGKNVCQYSHVRLYGYRWKIEGWNFHRGVYRVGTL